MASIMIVDDDPDSCEPVALYLRKSGHAVSCVPNGREAVLAVMDAPPDVVILDLVMPEMDGPTFLEVARSYLRLQSLPVVVLTAQPDSFLARRAKLLNVHATLCKTQATLMDIQQAAESAIGQRPA